MIKSELMDLKRKFKKSYHFLEQIFVALQRFVNLTFSFANLYLPILLIFYGGNLPIVVIS
jgi:hypothetical protein